MSQRARVVLMVGGAAFVSFVLSVTLWFSDNRDEGLFVGLWVPSILALGAFVMASFPRAGERGHE